MNFSAAIESLYHLNTGVVGSGQARHERPHKPVLVLATLDAIAAGHAQPATIPWSRWLRERFARYFEIVRAHNDECSPELPFLYLRSDQFWQPLRRSGGTESPLEAPPLARDLDSGIVIARFIPDWQLMLASPTARTVMRDALVSRYFPEHRAQLTALFLEPTIEISPADPIVAEQAANELAPARSAAFRREVLEIYDHHCVACGLRIWLPEHQLSFVDAAHIVPWSETWNDNPTNGLALCKNHHWAFDQRVIAPDGDGIWRVSRHLEPRRSPAEDALARLAGQRLLAPAESAYAPKREHLEWRLQRLLN